MRDGAGKAAAMLAHDGEEVVVRVALMQEHGLAHARSDRELASEGPALHVARGEVAVIVEPALTDRHEGGMRCEPFQLNGELVRQFRGMVRMDARGREQPARVRFGQLERAVRALAARAGHDHLYDAGGARAGDDLRPVAIEAVVREIDADVDERHLGILGRAGYAGKMLRRWTMHARLALAAAAVAAIDGAAAAGGAAAISRWLDLESRIQYAYYTEDRRALDEIAASLADTPSGEPEHSYYLALASYRQADLADPQRPADAKQPVERCVSTLDHNSGNAPGAAERLALQSTCLRLLAGLEPLRAPYLLVKSGVLLRRALADRDGQSDPAQVIRELEQTTAAFELERQDIERVPEWGAAEAYAFLGRAFLEQGQALAARGALEHALLLAPDFALAHRLMARITAG